MRYLFILALIIVGLGGAFMFMHTDSKTAMLNVNTIITQGPHAEQASKQIKQAQEIYQYNLNVIEKKLASYKNKEQARAYLIEAARQLQTQLNNSRVLVTQSLVNVLNTILEEQKQVYDLIVNQDGIIYVNEGSKSMLDKFKALPEDITVKTQALYNRASITFPAMPSKIDTPNLPADLGAGVAFPPKESKKEDTAKEKPTPKKK